MNGYKLYMMDRGHIRAAYDLTAETDGDAVAQAEELREGQPAELWNRSRLVTTFDMPQERSA